MTKSQAAPVLAALLFSIPTSAASLTEAEEAEYIANRDFVLMDARDRETAVIRARGGVEAEIIENAASEKARPVSTGEYASDTWLLVHNFSSYVKRFLPLPPGAVVVRSKSVLGEAAFLEAETRAVIAEKKKTWNKRYAQRKKAVALTKKIQSLSGKQGGDEVARRERRNDYDNAKEQAEILRLEIKLDAISQFKESLEARTTGGFRSLLPKRDYAFGWGETSPASPR